jgi:hypothetical protein
MRARLDALEGSVLLVPDTAMPAEPDPARLTAITSCRWLQADHNAELPKADMTPAERPAEDAPNRATEEKGPVPGVKVASSS